MLLDLPISIVFDLALLPATAFHNFYEFRHQPRPRAPRTSAPGATTPQVAADRVLEPEDVPPVVTESDPPQLPLSSGTTDSQ